MEKSEENTVNSENITQEIDFGENSENVEMNVEQENEKNDENTEEIDFGDGTVYAIEKEILEDDDNEEPNEEVEEHDEEPNEEVEEHDEELNEEQPDITETEGQSTEQQKSNATKKKPMQDSAAPKLVQLPISKIKQIMKFDPDVNLVSAEGLFLVARATELFVQSLAKEAYTHTAASKKKTIQKKDVESAIESVDTLMFLEGMMV